MTPLDLRIGVAGGLAEPVIERNTPVPIEQTRTFTTFQDHQESVQIRVYQGDHRMAADNALLGEFEFSGFTKGPRSDVKIDVTFEIDADGIVNVTASDQTTGEAASTQISLSSGLDEQQIEKILEEDVAGRVAAAVVPPESAISEVAEIVSEPSVLDDDSLFGDGSEDLSVGRPEDLGLIESAKADGLDDEELIQLKEESNANPPTDESPEDEGFFEPSGEDLAGPEIELTEEEK